MYDQKPVRIISGEMHYARIPHEYWKHRMQMLKAMGLNTVAPMFFGTSTNRNRINGISVATRI